MIKDKINTFFFFLVTGTWNKFFSRDRDFEL